MSSSKGRLAVRILAVGLCAGGIWVSHHLALLHVLSPEEKTAAKKEKGILDQACTTLLASGDCEQVVASEWGTIKIGEASMPTALLGLDYFIILLCWYVLIGEVPSSRWWAHLIVACLSAAGVGMSIFLLFQMSHLPKPCPLCIVTHVVNFLLFGCVLLLWPRKEPAPIPAVTITNSGEAQGDSLFAPAVPVASASSQSSSGPPLSMLAVVPVVALLAISTVALSLKARTLATQLENKLKTAEQTRDYYEKMWKHYDTKWQHTFTTWNINPPVKISLDRVPVRGPENARHTVVVYSDFQCPTCREFETWFKDKIQPIAARNGGVKVYFKYWPICTDCNPKATRNLHPMACKAALAAQAVLELGGNDAFWKMHDILFATQDQWSDKKKSKEFDFGTYAKQVGVDVGKFTETMNNPETLKRIQVDMLEGAGLAQEQVDAGKMKEPDRVFLSVDSTPSVYIDNKKLEVWSHAHTWLEILKQPAAAAMAAPSPASRRIRTDKYK